MAITASTQTAIDVPTLVSQLMSVERKPINDLNTKVTSYQSKISSFGTLSGLVSGMQTALTTLTSNLQGYSTASSDTSVFSATASSAAVGGTYSVSVAHLAQAQTLVAGGQASQTSALTSSASTLTFSIGGKPSTVDIPANASLQDISAAINSANLGISASIVNDGSASPYRLSISASSTGLSNAIDSISNNAIGDANLTSLLSFNSSPTTAMAEVVKPLDASLTVNGIPITSSSNTLTTAIQGVTLTLKTPNTTPTTLTVARDTSAINTAVSGFVDAYNALASQLRSRSAYGATTSTAPALAGDGTVRAMLEQLRGILMTPANGTLSTLAQVGITSKTDGTLTVSDSSKLTGAIASNFSGVSDLFTSSSGFATRLNTWATSVTQTGGMIDLRTKSLNNSIKGYNDRITNLEKRMSTLQAQYTTTYSNLNTLLSNMNATSTYLTQQFSKSSSG